MWSRGFLKAAPELRARRADINKADAARAQCAHQFSENDMVIKARAQSPRSAASLRAAAAKKPLAQPRGAPARSLPQ